MLLQFDLQLFGLLVTTLVEENIQIKWEVVTNRISWGWFTLTLIPLYLCWYWNSRLSHSALPIAWEGTVETQKFVTIGAVNKMLLLTYLYIYLWFTKFSFQNSVFQNRSSSWSNKEAGHLTSFFFTSQFRIHWISAKTNKWQIRLDETATYDLYTLFFVQIKHKRWRTLMGADESMRVHIRDVTVNQLNAFVDLFSHNLLITILCITERPLIFSGVKKSNFLLFFCKQYQTRTTGVLIQLLLNCPTSTLHQVFPSHSGVSHQLNAHSGTKSGREEVN